LHREVAPLVEGNQALVRLFWNLNLATAREARSLFYRGHSGLARNLKLCFARLELDRLTTEHFGGQE